MALPKLLASQKASTSFESLRSAAPVQAFRSRKVELMIYPHVLKQAALYRDIPWLEFARAKEPAETNCSTKPTREADS